MKDVSRLLREVSAVLVSDTATPLQRAELAAKIDTVLDRAPEKPPLVDVLQRFEQAAEEGVALRNLDALGRLAARYRKMHELCRTAVASRKEAEEKGYKDHILAILYKALTTTAQEILENR